MRVHGAGSFANLVTLLYKFTVAAHWVHEVLSAAGKVSPSMPHPKCLSSRYGTLKSKWIHNYFPLSTTFENGLFGPLCVKIWKHDRQIWSEAELERGRWKEWGRMLCFNRIGYSVHHQQKQNSWRFKAEVSCFPNILKAAISSAFLVLDCFCCWVFFLTCMP